MRQRSEQAQFYLHSKKFVGDSTLPVVIPDKRIANFAGTVKYEKNKHPRGSSHSPGVRLRNKLEQFR